MVFTRPGSASEEIVVAAETRERDEAALKAAIVAKVSEEFQRMAGRNRVWRRVEAPPLMSPPM